MKVAYTTIAYENEQVTEVECESLRHDVHPHTGLLTLTLYENHGTGPRMFVVVSSVLSFRVAH